MMIFHSVTIACNMECCVHFLYSVYALNPSSNSSLTACAPRIAPFSHWTFKPTCHTFCLHLIYRFIHFQLSKTKTAFCMSKILFFFFHFPLMTDYKCITYPAVQTQPSDCRLARGRAVRRWGWAQSCTAGHQMSAVPVSPAWPTKKMSWLALRMCGAWLWTRQGPSRWQGPAPSTGTSLRYKPAVSEYLFTLFCVFTMCWSPSVHHVLFVNSYQRIMKLWLRSFLEEIYDLKLPKHCGREMPVSWWHI